MTDQAKSLRRRLEAVSDGYLLISTYCIEAIGITALTFMVTINAINIFRRYLVGDDMGWVQEISPMAAMSVYFLAYALIAKEERYVRIEFVVRLLPPRAEAAVAIAARLAILLFQGMLFYLAVQQAWFARIFHTSVLELSETLFYLPLVLGSFDILVTEAIYLARALSGRGPMVAASPIRNVAAS